MTHPAQLPTLTDRLTAGEDLTRNDLDALRMQVPSLPRAEQQRIDAALLSFERRNTLQLESDETTRTALEQLQQVLLEQQRNQEGPAESLGRQAGALLDTTADRAKAIGYHQWVELMHPERSTATKTMQVLGILGLGYGVYRAAKWIKGQPDSSFLGRAFRFMGIAAAAGFAINKLGSNLEDRSTSDAPPAVPPVPPANPIQQPAADVPLTIDDARLENRDLLSSPVEMIVDGMAVSLIRPNGSETMLRVGNHTYQLLLGDTPAGSLLTAARFEQGEYHLTARMLFELKAYIPPSEMQRVAMELCDGPAEKEIEMTYFTAPASDTAREEHSKTIRFVRMPHA